MAVLGPVLVLALAMAASLEGTAPRAPKVSPPTVTVLFEAYSPLARAPVGRLSAPPAEGPWLEVSTTGAETEIRFLPEDRVRWTVRAGPHGPVEKVTWVDDQVHTTSRFLYDHRGHIRAKHVSGPGLDRPLLFRYRTDDGGRVLERTLSFRDAPAEILERWHVAWGASAVATTWRHGRAVRRDTFALDGRRLETVVDPDGLAMTLRYERDDGGALVRRSASPIDRLGTEHVSAAAAALLERHEVRALLGPPARARDEGRGRDRRLSDDFATSCWLNQVSALSYDPTGLVESGQTTCICGG